MSRLTPDSSISSSSVMPLSNLSPVPSGGVTAKSAISMKHSFSPTPSSESNSGEKASLSFEINGTTMLGSNCLAQNVPLKQTAQNQFDIHQHMPLKETSGENAKESSICNEYSYVEVNSRSIHFFLFTLSPVPSGGVTAKSAFSMKHSLSPMSSSGSNSGKNTSLSFQINGTTMLGFNCLAQNVPLKQTAQNQFDIHQHMPFHFFSSLLNQWSVCRSNQRYHNSFISPLISKKQFYFRSNFDASTEYTASAATFY